MQQRKIRVGILFGGKSAEHEVSLQSAKNIIEAIDKDKFDVILIGIDKQGQWHLNDRSRFLLDAHDPKLIKLNAAHESVTLVPGKKEDQLLSVTQSRPLPPLDVVFPVLHGPLGEDGTIQGLLKIVNVPFVGAGVLASAVGMDKDVFKRLLRDAGLPQARFISVRRSQAAALDFDEIVRELGLPFFLKPANMGSSVGVHKIKDRDGFGAGLKDAFRYDQKILIEEFIAGREIECAVLGNEDPMASLPGEVMPTHEFYSYESKYIDEKGAQLQIPAHLPPDIIQRAQELAVNTFRVIGAEGLARVDMFIKADGSLLVNEINTLPGFTKISMYPKLWEASGLSYPELIERLILLALERYEHEQQLKTDFDLP